MFTTVVHHLHMMVKHLLLGMGLMFMSFSAFEMMVCICPLKKRAFSGLTAPGCDSSLSMAFLSCHTWVAWHTAGV